MNNTAMRHSSLLHRTCWSILFFLFFSLTTYAIQLDGATYTIDTLENFRIGPGSRYTALRLFKVNATVSNRLDVFFVKIDATNPYISFRTVIGRDSIIGGERPTAMAARKSVEGANYFAGTNGGFYATTGDVGLPTYGVVVDKQLARTPNNSDPIVSVDTENFARFGRMRFTGNALLGDTAIKINHVNYTRNENELVLYNQYNGKVTRTNSYGTELLLQLLSGQEWGVNKTVRAKIIKIEKGVGSMAIPEGYAVLSGHGTAQTLLDSLAQTDMEIQLTLNMTIAGMAADYSAALGGDNYDSLMLKNGVVETNVVWNELHPRTGFGSSVTGDTIIMCVVDGRGLSAGCTTKLLAELMLASGAYNAKNMDGGGSSCIYVKEFGQMNTPSDGTERAVADGIFAVSSAPTDNTISQIYAYNEVVSVPRYGVVQPRFLGYNQYGTLINTDVQGVVLSCNEAVGEIQADGSFLASGSQGGSITATYNGNITTTIAVKLITEAKVAFRLDSVLIDNRAGYSMEVQSIIGIDTVQVLPAALTWEVANPAVCTAENGRVIGLTNGSTYVYGSLGTFSDSILVNVEIPDQTPLMWDSFAPAEHWTLTCSSGFGAEFAYSDCGENCPTEILFSYQAARGPFLKMEYVAPLYGLPDTVRFSLNTNALFSKIIIGLRPNNVASSGTVGVNFTSIPQNEDVTLSVPMSQLVSNITDAAIYPIWMQYITLNLDASNTAGNYFVKLNGITLCYNGLELTNLNSVSATTLQVYPNPTNSLLHIVHTSENAVQMQLFDLQGKLQKSQLLTNKTTDINISDLSAGTYLLRIGTENIKVVKK